MSTGEAAEFLSSERGGKLLAFSGFIYAIDKVVNEKTHWKCQK